MSRVVSHRGRLVALCLLTIPACAQQMGSQPAYRPLQPNDFFADGRASRPLVAGTVARGQLHADTALETGHDDRGDLATVFPFEMSKDVLERGRQRYDIFCSVCHGLTGHGDGRIVQRGFTKPPDLITDVSRAYKIKEPDKPSPPLTSVPVGHVFEVITKGYGAMPDYASQIPVRDRWAIVGYVRALQFSQSPAARKAIEATFEKGGKQ